MAQRRMFSKKITDTDLFLDMPMSAQCLYFHMNMEADDDGFLGNAKTIRRKIGASEDDLKLLIAKKFIIPFESGVVVIKDWKIHNYIAKDRYSTTVYKDEKQQLELDENGAYQLSDTPLVDGLYTSDIQNVYQMDTQDRIGKDRIGKDRVERELQSNSEVTDGNKVTSLPKSKYGEYQNVSLTEDEYNRLKAEYPNHFERYIESLSNYIASSGKKYKSHNATIRMWLNRDKVQKGQVKEVDLTQIDQTQSQGQLEFARMYGVI